MAEMIPWEIAAIGNFIAVIPGVLFGRYWYRRALKAERLLSDWQHYGGEVIEMRRKAEKGLGIVQQ